jgi:hypothetical protein
LFCSLYHNFLSTVFVLFCSLYHNLFIICICFVLFFIPQFFLSTVFVSFCFVSVAVTPSFFFSLFLQKRFCFALFLFLICRIPDFFKLFFIIEIIIGTKYFKFATAIASSASETRTHRFYYLI